MFRKIFNLLGKDDLIKIIIYSLIDICVGIYIGKILSINFDSKNKESVNSENKDKKKINKNFISKKSIIDNYLIEVIYLFNPLSIISCLGMQLRVIYNFLFFSLIFNLNIEIETEKPTRFHRIMSNMIFAIINLLCNPANAFIVSFYYFRILYLAPFTMKINLFICWLLSISFMCGCLYYAFDVNEFYAVITQYRNYFFIKDSLPNIGLMWGLFPEVY